MARSKRKRKKTEDADEEGAPESPQTVAARNLVHRHTLMAMGSGILPFPVVDIVGLTLVQLRMLRRLAAHYDIDYSERRARRLLFSLLVGGSGIGIGVAIASSAWKSIPVVGHAIAGISVPLIAGSLTFAVGQTFTMHFGLGGTLLDFDPDKMREHFKEEYGRGKAEVIEMDGAQAEDEADSRSAKSA